VDSEVERLQRAIAALKAQRAALGDDATDLALGPLQQRLAQLQQGQRRRRSSCGRSACCSSTSSARPR
jgi:hypothetical protein